MLDGAPPLGHQREAAFALVAQGAEQRVAGSRIDIEFAVARLSSPGRRLPRQRLHNRNRRGPGSFPQDGRRRQDELAGGGEVMGAAGQHVRDPQRDPARAASACTFPAGSCAFPEYHLSISFPFLLVFLSAHRSRRSACRPGSGREAPAQRPFPEPRAASRLRGEHLDSLVLVPVRGGLRDPGPAQPVDVPGPGTAPGEDSLLPAGQSTCPVPGAELAAVFCQQPGHEQNQLNGTSRVTR